MTKNQPTVCRDWQTVGLVLQFKNYIFLVEDVGESGEKNKHCAPCESACKSAVSLRICQRLIR